jgi:hypothetical protein
MIGGATRLAESGSQRPCAIVQESDIAAHGEISIALSDKLAGLLGGAHKGSQDRICPGSGSL